jgi:hypothetical protein
MDNAIKDYALAVKESIEASHAETEAILRKKLAREKLAKAKQELHDMELELINN